MELIPSFTVDHIRLLPGIYVSRIDTIGNSYATTFDIRMKRPNLEPVLHPNAMHTIEHIVATFLRNDKEWKDNIVYRGPMGCLTGCYLIVKGKLAPQDVLDLMIRAFEHTRDFEGEIPGAQPINCGNYLLQDLPMAKYEAGRYVEILKNNPCFEYPKAQ